MQNEFRTQCDSKSIQSRSEIYKIEKKYKKYWYDNSLKIDIILGSDSFWEIIDSKIQVDDSFHIIKTKFGEILARHINQDWTHHKNNNFISQSKQIISSFINFWKN